MADRLLPMFFMGLIALAGLAVIRYAIRDYRKCRAIARGAKVTGKIISARIETWQPLEEPNLWYKAIITYSYRVGSECYDKFLEHNCTNNEERAKKFLLRYPMDLEVTVYYAHSDPQMAELEQRDAGWFGSTIVGMVGLGIFLFGAWVLRVGFEKLLR